eukprot:9180-Pelagomonas_calceolata.AAC.3
MPPSCTLILSVVDCSDPWRIKDLVGRNQLQVLGLKAKINNACAFKASMDDHVPQHPRTLHAKRDLA